MDEIEAAVNELIDAGIAPARAAAMVVRLAMQVAGAQQSPSRTARQDRNARYYQSRKDRLNESEKRLKTSDEAPQNVPPTPPLETTSQTNPPSTPTGSQTPKGVSARGHRLPEDWEPMPEAFDYAAKLKLTSADVAACAEEMRDWAVANANRPIARKSDWDRTFQGFLRRRAERMARAGPRPVPVQDRAAAFLKHLG